MKCYKNKIIQIVIINTFFIAGIWGMFLINNIMLGGNLSYGVHPRNVGLMELFGISFSWIFHANKVHLIGNTIALITMIPMIATFERRPWFVLWSMIIMSGFVTWCFGAPNTNHIGASGLIFAIMSYTFTAAIFGKKFLYWIPIILSGGSYLFSIKTGLVPENEVSFAAHFGGLLSGVILALFMAKEEDKNRDFGVNIYPKYSIPVKPIAWSALPSSSIKKNKWYLFWKKNN